MTVLILSGILGFLLASLAALFLAPPLWRRAVRMTSQKLHQQSPRMMDDSRADRDIMRAEFAVSTRKMEVQQKQLQEESSLQLIETSKLHDENSRLETKAGKLEGVVQTRDKKIVSLNKRFKKLQADYTKKSNQLIAQTELTIRAVGLNGKAPDTENEYLSEINDNSKLPPVKNHSHAHPQSSKLITPLRLHSDNSNDAVDDATTDQDDASAAPKTKQDSAKTKKRDTPPSLAERIRSLQNERP